MLIVSAVLSHNKESKTFFLNSINDTQLLPESNCCLWQHCAYVIVFSLQWHVYTHYWWMAILLTHPTNVSHHSTFLAIDAIFPESLCFCLLLRASPSCLMLVSFVWFLFMPYNLLCLLFYFWTLDFLLQFLHNVSNFLTCNVPLVACAFLKTLIGKQPSLAYTAFPR